MRVYNSCMCSHADLATAVSKELVSLKAELEARQVEAEAMKAEAADAVQVGRACAGHFLLTQ